MSRFHQLIQRASTMTATTPLVVFGPSGVGKGTLIKRLFADYPDKFAFSVSHTTRAPRPGETDGKEYHFVTQDTFKSLLSENAFIEHAQFSGNFYGTSVRAIEAVQSTGRRCILDIESQGVRQVKETDLHPVYVFISPPSMGVLRERLRGRATDSEEAIQKRLATAIVEISYAREEGACDYIIVNDDLDTAYNKFRDVALGNPIQGDTLPPLDD
ncbi:P-loop containing nucleoside triphosphate hydrolase protein [Pisolithus orientalis]|uniref:P-loop containing nucleoside triphosphate hydrolase protein n=1 Tax=Pisolithus orientalis TaxID=936130 RepID=UPI002224896C|nr:P-loop containing nucleoside triphosphate hydrolase protein [Pisolithus orientalis]KAI6001018.1 P-loop containing nucleoside triphosphate hydrolase protein [Pisolithus orientalis]